VLREAKRSPTDYPARADADEIISTQDLVTALPVEFLRTKNGRFLQTSDAHRFSAER
jgi:hypothetical protein